MTNNGGTLSLTGALNAGSNAVNLTASTTIGQTAAGVITGGLLTTSSATGTDLSTATNAIASLNASNSGVGVVKLLDSVATLTVTGIGDTTTGGPVTVSNTGGAISLTGAVNTGSNAVNLTAFTTLGQTAGGVITGGLLTTSSATGTDLSPATNAVTSFHATNSSVGVLKLADATATLTVTAISDTTAGGSVSVNNSVGALSLTGAVNAGSNAVNLTASTSVGQTSAGVITGGLLTTSSATGTDLSTATNAVTSFNATNSGAGVVKLLDGVTTLTITGISDTTAGGPISVTNSGSLSLTGAVNAGGNAVNLTGTGSGTAITEGTGGTIGTTGTLTTSSTGGTSLGNANTVSTFHGTDTSSAGSSLTNSAATLTIAGISQTGGGSINVTNAGGLTTTGSVATAANGSITLSATGVETIGATLTAGGDGTVTLTNGGQLNLNADVTGDGGFTQNGAGAVATTGSRIITTVGGPISFASAVTLGGNLTVTAGTGGISFNSVATPALALGANSLTVINTTPSVGLIAGQITGTGGLVKQGTGTLTLAGSGSSYSGPTTLNGGTLQVNGSIASVVTLNHLTGTPATLAGSGTVGGISAGSAGGTIAPGPLSGFGTLTSAGSVTLNGNTTYLLQLNGHATPGAPVVGTDYRHLQANGSLNLNGAALQLSFGATPSRLEDVYSLISLPGEATASRFGSITVTGSPGASLSTGADGTVVTLGTQQYQLTYRGGAGVLSPTSTDINFTHLDVVRNATGLVIPSVAQVGSVFQVPATQALATFTDDMGKLPQHFLALISWGDNTASSVGTVTLQGSTYTIHGGHTYTAPGASRSPSSWSSTAITTATGTRAWLRPRWCSGFRRSRSRMPWWSGTVTRRRWVPLSTSSRGSRSTPPRSTVSRTSPPAIRPCCTSSSCNRACS